jgi:hypothetical protein
MAINIIWRDVLAVGAVLSLGNNNVVSCCEENETISGLK